VLIYDPACEELALRFLADLLKDAGREATLAEIQEMAQRIQDAVEWSYQAIVEYEQRRAKA
jgi:hypothetical protein